MDIRSFIQSIETIAPLFISCPWDASGVQMHSARKKVNSVAVMLDATVDTIKTVAEHGFDFIISHHPIRLNNTPMHYPSFYHSIVSLLIEHNISLYSAHTSLDANIYGPAGFLARILGMENIRPIEVTHTTYTQAYTIYTEDQNNIYAHLQQYSVDEYSVQHTTPYSICIHSTASICSAFSTFLCRTAIPHTIAKVYGSEQSFGIGCVGTLYQKISKEHLLKILYSICGKTPIASRGTMPEELSTIAYCPGAGSSLLSSLDPTAIDVYITGEVKHHNALETTIPILDVGHFSLEEAMMKEFATQLQDICPECTIHFIPSSPPFTYLYKE